jgi:hypothetical protein
MGESLPPEETEAPPTTGRRRWSVLSHLVALVVVVAAVAVSIASYVTVQGYNDARRRASAQLRETVDLAARAVRQDLEEVATQTATLLPSLAPAFAATAGPTGSPSRRAA